MATLGNAIGNAAAIRAALRARIGYSNDTVLVPDALADEALRDALARVNRMNPAIGVGSFTTVDDQQSYTPLPAGAYQILRAWWPNQSACRLLLDEADAWLTQPIDEFGTRVMLEPAGVEIVRRQYAALRQQIGGRAVVREIDGASAIYLIPVPSTAVTVLFSYSTPRYATTTAVDEYEGDAFFCAAEIVVHRALTAGAGGVSQIKDGSEQSEIRTKAPEHHLKLARDAEVRFQRMWAPPRQLSVFP